MFDVAYRKVIAPSESGPGSAHLLVTVRNKSGSDAKDVVAFILEQNNVTEEHVLIGNLSRDQRVEVMHPVGMPAEGASEVMDESAVWSIEYSDDSGARRTVLVQGTRVQ
ncbi:MAG: hypothetical protein A2078_08880 [Nitrospirae bacterium GWC2_57_9]|nr:MAG: hypothetical protein A2078_08880 [Nitrospirae bacterium GWC2_57_9]